MKPDKIHVIPSISASVLVFFDAFRLILSLWIICTVCGEEYGGDVYPATGHDFGEWGSNNGGNHTRVCYNDRGEIETEVCNRNDAGSQCTVCGYWDQLKCNHVDTGRTYSYPRFPLHKKKQL